MEKISFISLSFLVLFLLVSCDKSSTKGSSDWVKYKVDENGGVLSYKKGNIKKDDGYYIVQVWGKLVFSDKDREEEIQVREKNGFSIEGYDKLSEEIFLDEIDCKKRIYSTLSMKGYDTDGKVLFTEKYDDDKLMLGYIVPGSYRDTVLKKFCK
jgi:hypothetical protein